VSPFHASGHAGSVSAFPSGYVAGDGIALYRETAVGSVCPLSPMSLPQLCTHQHVCKQQ